VQLRHKLFISYRRSDSVYFAKSLHGELSSDFDIFFDTEDSIEYGEEFPLALKKGLESSDVLMLIIGKNWDEELEKREGGNDFVIEEILYAKKLGLVILPILMDGVDMPEEFPDKIEFVSKLNAFLFGRGSFSLYINGLKDEIKKLPIRDKYDRDAFLNSVEETLKVDRMLVLLSQTFTHIDNYLHNLKEILQHNFKDRYFEIYIPPFIDSQEAYVSSIAKDTGLGLSSFDFSSFYSSVKKSLKDSKEPLVLFVHHIENGNRDLDKNFATILRNLKNEFLNIYILFVGQKELARLVYGEGVLSPLNSATELFFPEEYSALDEDKIAQQFAYLARRYREQICRLLKKDRLSRYSTWSYDDTINELFWRNLLVKRGRFFAWRDEMTKNIAKEILLCKE